VGRSKRLVSYLARPVPVQPYHPTAPVQVAFLISTLPQLRQLVARPTAQKQRAAVCIWLRGLSCFQFFCLTLKALRGLFVRYLPGDVADTPRSLTKVRDLANICGHVMVVGHSRP